MTICDSPRCKECVHLEACVAWIRHGNALFDDYRYSVEECPYFDHIEGVGEIVLCKNCKHYRPYQQPVVDFDGECIARECETDEFEYCSYGVKKED